MLNRNFLSEELLKLPIGSQAETLEKLDLINDTWYMKKPLKITKGFQWGPNTYSNIKDIINNLRWGYTQKRNMSHLLKSDGSGNYYSITQFKNNLKRIDAELQQLRSRNAIWTDNDDESYLNIINELKDKFVNELSDVKKLYNMEIEYLDNIDVNILVHELNVNNKSSNKLYIIKDSDYIYLVFDFICDIEVFNEECTIPIDSIPYGKILCVVKYSNKYDLAKSLLGTSSPQIGVLPKPYNEDTPHPFISRGNIYDPNHNYSLYFISTNGAYCTGSVTIPSHFGSFNLVKGINQFKIWLNTYRLGVTSPLNSFRESFMGIRKNYNQYDNKINSISYNCINRVKDEKTCVECSNNYTKLMDDYPDISFNCENLHDAKVEDLTTEEIQKKMVRWASSQQQR